MQFDVEKASLVRLSDRLIPLNLTFSQYIRENVKYFSVLELQCAFGYSTRTIEYLTRSFLPQVDNGYVILIGLSNPLNTLSNSTQQCHQNNILLSDKFRFAQVSNIRELQAFISIFTNSLKESSKIEPDKQILFIINDLPLLLRAELNLDNVLPALKSELITTILRSIEELIRTCYGICMIMTCREAEASKGSSLIRDERDPLLKQWKSYFPNPNITVNA